MLPQSDLVAGILRKGYGVASGPSSDYPYGALERQAPIFKLGGLDLDGFFLGTLNIDIRPMTFELIRPDFTFRDVRWTDLHPPEHFSFARCKVLHDAGESDGWIYYPHPENKRRHFQDASLLEVIAQQTPTLKTGDRLRVRVDPGRVAFKRPAQDQPFNDR